MEATSLHPSRLADGFACVPVKPFRVSAFQLEAVTREDPITAHNLLCAAAGALGWAVGPSLCPALGEALQQPEVVVGAGYRGCSVVSEGLWWQATGMSFAQAGQAASPC